MLALIDGDIVAYTAAARAEQTVEFADGMTHIWGDPAATEASIEEFVASVALAVGADRVLLALSCQVGNFRKDVYPAYKSNRKSKRKPVTFAHARSFITKTYEVMERPGLEADDILAIVATGKIRGLCGKRVVCSIDKDMKTFPCQLFNWMKPEDGIVTITETEADYNFYKQILTGDSTDGYPGCPGIGEVRASRLLDPALGFASNWQSIVGTYEAKGLTEDDAITQARCARILRACDYDFKNKRPILWTPPREE